MMNDPLRIGSAVHKLTSVKDLAAHHEIDEESAREALPMMCLSVGSPTIIFEGQHTAASGPVTCVKEHNKAD